MRRVHFLAGVAEMPFADHAGRVAGFMKEFGERSF
jgi:hypothetical protein